MRSSAQRIRWFMGRFQKLVTWPYQDSVFPSIAAFAPSPQVKIRAARKFGHQSFNRVAFADTNPGSKSL